MANKEKFDLFQIVTDRIIAQLEAGQIPWQKPWINVDKRCELAVSYTTGKPYSLLNQMLLGEPGEYITYKQCAERGGKVKSGEKSRMVVFWKMLAKDKKDDNGNPVMGKDGKPQKEMIPLLQYYNVFHIRQCDGIEPRHTNLEPIEAPDDMMPDETAEEIITGYINRSGVTLVHHLSNRAFYRPSDDMVVLPEFEQFKAAAEYYSTAFHELTHSTGHPKRLNRLDKKASFGSENYSKEELVAEIGASALVNHVGLETESSFRNNAAYVQNWLTALKNDKRLIVSASGKAEKAVNLILGTETKQNERESE
ncbi:MAG: DUF1738 domain-containing protein [Bacteroidaceae bacterium]|nr:DUF1738 domain-containing protein [Bacteroidaceae bacterium]